MALKKRIVEVIVLSICIATILWVVQFAFLHKVIVVVTFMPRSQLFVINAYTSPCSLDLPFELIR